MKLTITTLVIVEGSYIQGIFHSLEEHPGKAYQELVDQVENEYGYDADKDHVPLEDFTWLIEIFSTMTDDTDTYDFATFDREAANGEPPYPVIEINRKGLANFLNDDQGYESGISMYGHYIACKSLDISSEEEYMNQLTDIELIYNEL